MVVQYNVKSELCNHVCDSTVRTQNDYDGYKILIYCSHFLSVARAALHYCTWAWESPSALPCCRPAQCWISKLYPWSASTDRATWPSGCLKFKSQVTGAWSVWMRKWWPCKYGWKCYTGRATASSLHLVMQYYFFAQLKAEVGHHTLPVLSPFREDSPNPGTAGISVFL